MLFALSLVLPLSVLGANPCPDGDGARGGLADYDDGASDVGFDVDDDGVGHVRYLLRFENHGDSAARGAQHLSSVSKEQPLIVTRARLRGQPWAALDDAGDAAASYEGFVDALENGVDDEFVKDGKRRVALLVSRADDDIAVDVAGACSARSVVVEVEALLAPLPSPLGWRYAVPSPGKGAVLVVDAHGKDVFIDGVHGKRGVFGGEDDSDASFDVDVDADFVGISARGAVVTLTPQLPPPEPVDPEAPVVEVDPSFVADKPVPFTLAHAAIALPEHLSTTPAELRVVFVVDASVSAGDDGVAFAKKIVDAWLDAAPEDARWALVTAARTPQLLIGPWRARDQRAWPRVEVQNGSDIAAAIALARKIADDAVEGSGRVVVLSDLQLSFRNEPRLAVEVGAAGAHGPLLHMLELPADVGAGADRAGHTRVFGGEADSLGAGRDVRAYAVERTGGIFVTVYEVSGDDVSGDVRDLGRHLVRPRYIDRPLVLIDGARIEAGDDVAASVTTFGNSGALDGFADRLYEGEGLRASWRLPRGRAATFTGLLWAQTLDVPVTTSPTQKTLALAVGGIGMLSNDLDDDQVRAAANAGHFVSRVTSLVDVPAWRPGRPAGLMGHGCSCCGCGCGGFGCHGGSHCTIGTRDARVSQTQALLDQLAAEAADVCHVVNVDVDVEFGDGEVLAVDVEGGDTCVGEFFWRARLDRLSNLDFEQHETRHAHAAGVAPEG